MAASIDSSREWFEETGWHFDSNNDFVDKDVEIKKLIFKELEKRFQLETYPVPSRRIDKNDQKNSPYCPQVFVSRDVMSNPNLLVIVQGLGEVPPGQWARKLFTNGDEFTERVKAIALLDGENGMERYEELEDDGQWLREHSQAFSRRTMESFMAANEQAVPTNDHDSVPGIAVDAVFEYLEKEHTRYESSLLEDDLGEGTSKPAQASKDPLRPPTAKPYVPSQNHGSVELMKKFLQQR
ncbi:hypothetical protein BGX34_002001 [Mortierella sp. NVP85]|nr:hypothetical protein BGX34_002001 [Mortierella sp. NVP85]